MSMWRLACLPAAALAFDCDDGTCAANLLQVETQKVRRVRSDLSQHKELVEASSAAAAVPPSTEIKVITAGYGRSGSTTMECALMHLGFNPNRGDLIYRKHGKYVSDWVHWLTGGPFQPALDQLLSLGYNATSSDLPTGIAWRELHERFPTAKVVNLVHPSGIQGFLKDLPVKNFLVCKMWYIKYFVKCCDMSLKLTTEQRLDMCAKEYTDEHEKIVSTIPPEQLLTYTVADGWDPLAKFLGLPAPAAPFPRVHGGQIQMCYPDGQPEILYDDNILGIDGLLSPEGKQRGEELQEASKKRALNPEEQRYLRIYRQSEDTQEEARQEQATSSESSTPAL